MDVFLAIIGIILTYTGVRYARKQYLLQKREPEKQAGSGQKVKQEVDTGNGNQAVVQNAGDVKIDQSKHIDKSVHVDKSTHILDQSKEKIHIEHVDKIIVGEPIPQKQPSEKKTTPKPLPPYIAHPYPMQENFTGRDEERRMLGEWFEEGDKPMLALIAIGGMGIVWHGIGCRRIL